MTIGDRIKKRRIQLDMSQDELAKLVGYKSRSSINKLEKDGRELQQRKIIEFARALHTTPAYIMGWEESKEDSDGAKDAQLLKKYHSLSDAQQQVVLSLIDTLLAQK